MSHLYAHSVIRTRKPLNIFLFFVNTLELSGKKSLVAWLHECGIETLPDLTDQINIMFGLFDVDNHFMLLNHIMLIAKQTIFLCRQKSITPSFIIFLTHLKKIFRIEEYLAKEKKKLNLHLMKWEKLLQSLSWNNSTLGSLVLIFLFIYLFIYWPYTILFTLYCCNFFKIFFIFFKCKTEKHNKIYIKKSFSFEKR